MSQGLRVPLKNENDYHARNMNDYNEKNMNGYNERKILFLD